MFLYSPLIYHIAMRLFIWGYISCYPIYTEYENYNTEIYVYMQTC